ncbi:hypothetical protein NDU88_003639 [Pleurodeles waltl]|uniref:Uncharacterized protein n=1 Tax=Pleurodeles waltl TaxID=8319 RepID=A0AAV7LG02_PLEWA|nr:hypothetical protein NDU88_003639 [Pleurodeles waltl]
MPQAPVCRGGRKAQFSEQQGLHSSAAHSGSPVIPNGPNSTSGPGGQPAGRHLTRFWSVFRPSPVSPMGPVGTRHFFFTGRHHTGPLLPGALSATPGSAELAGHCCSAADQVTGPFSATLALSRLHRGGSSLRPFIPVMTAVKPSSLLHHCWAADPAPHLSRGPAQPRAPLASSAARTAPPPVRHRSPPGLGLYPGPLPQLRIASELGPPQAAGLCHSAIFGVASVSSRHHPGRSANLVSRQLRRRSLMAVARPTPYLPIHPDQGSSGCIQVLDGRGFYWRMTEGSGALAILTSKLKKSDVDI